MLNFCYKSITKVLQPISFLLQKYYGTVNMSGPYPIIHLWRQAGSCELEPQAGKAGSYKLESWNRPAGYSIQASWKLEKLKAGQLDTVYKLEAGSWKHRQAGSCPEKSTERWRAGNSIRAGTSQNGNHRFLARDGHRELRWRQEAGDSPR